MRAIRSYVVLVVEDDPALSKLYSEKLRMDGFNVLVAHDGETGLQLAIEKNPDFILLDMMLPKQNGFDLLVQLKQDARGKHIPVISLTNLTDRAKANEALKMGVKEYLAKAMYTPDEIVVKIRAHLPKEYA